MNQTENKIAQRYRQMIVDAFFALCRRFNYDEITILMIAQEADVSSRPSTVISKRKMKSSITIWTPSLLT